MSFAVCMRVDERGKEWNVKRSMCTGKIRLWPVAG